jgi:chemotaxis protein methyltransferase CheR
MAPIRRGAATDMFESLAVVDAPREFAFSEADFRSLAQLASKHAGIVLTESKRNLVYGRLSRRLRALKLSSFREYRELLASDEREFESFINSLSTNHTKFFREEHHFDHFRAHVAIPFAQTAGRDFGGRLRIWSAGCSTGEEPYTIAFVLKREIRNAEDFDIRILATDIDTDVLTKAARGEFAATALADVPQSYRGFLVGAGNGGGADKIIVDRSICSLIAFRQLNLIQPWPFRGLFDAIFCRNVMIYFDSPTKLELVRRFTHQIKPGGWLYIGHSESLLGSHEGLQFVGRTVYRRTK